jgi:hypothetical protein
MDMGPPRPNYLMQVEYLVDPASLINYSSKIPENVYKSAKYIEKVIYGIDILRKELDIFLFGPYPRVEHNEGFTVETYPEDSIKYYESSHGYIHSDSGYYSPSTKSWGKW